MTQTRRGWLKSSILVVTALALLGAWIFQAVLDPRLGSQPEMEGMVAPAGFDRSDGAQIDGLLSGLADTFAARPMNAGLAIGVTRRGVQHVALRGHAVAHESRRPVNESTLFEIGSVTKPITGLLLAQAVLNGEVTLDQRTATLIPNAGAAAPRDVTLEQLATHSSGLPDSPPSVSWWAMTFGEHPAGAVSAAEAITALREATADGSDEPGYAYSNLGFMLLGELLEVATHEDYADLVRTRVTEPLGMTETWVSPPEAAHADLAVGYRMGRETEPWHEWLLPGAGSVVSTLPDMLKFLEAHLHPDATPIGPAVRLAATPRREASGERRIGLGWHFVTTERGLLGYHLGATAGFRSYVGYLPAEELGIVVLANSRDISGPRIGRLLMRTLAGLEP